MEYELDARHTLYAYSCTQSAYKLKLLLPWQICPTPSTLKLGSAKRCGRSWRGDYVSHMMETMPLCPVFLGFSSRRDRIWSLRRSLEVDAGFETRHEVVGVQITVCKYLKNCHLTRNTACSYSLKVALFILCGQNPHHVR